MFVRCGGIFFYRVTYFFHVFTCEFFTYFFTFLRENFSRENKFRSRMFVRCGVFFFPVDRGCLRGVGYFFF